MQYSPPNDSIAEQVMRFINGQSTVEPGQFLNNLKTLKGMANGH